MNTLIRNGTVVTADDTVAGRRPDRRRDDQGGRARHSRQTPRDKVIDATGMYVLPGGIDVPHPPRHAVRRHHVAPTISKPAPAPRPSAAPPRIVDFAIQAARHPHARRPRHLVEEGRRQGLHRLRPAHDRHRSGRLPASKTWTTWCDEGVASFKLFMAYPNVLMVDDATIFKALSQTAKNGALICMHAENGSVIDVIVAARPGRGQDRAHLSRPHPSAARRSRSRAPRHRHGGDRRRAGLHRAPLFSEDALNQVREARDRGVPAFAETCPQYLLLSIEELERPEFRRRQVRLHAAAARQSSICRNSGTVSSTITCRWSPPTTAPSVSKTRRSSAKTISPRFPTAAPASRTACS